MFDTAGFWCTWLWCCIKTSSGDAYEFRCLWLFTCNCVMFCSVLRFVGVYLNCALRLVSLLLVWVDLWVGWICRGVAVFRNLG